MQRILVPTEFTYLSKCALNLGMQLAKLANAEVRIASVVEPLHNDFMEERDEYSHDPTSSIRNIEITEEARARMHERAEEVSKWFPDQIIAPKILFGNKVKSLVKEVNEQAIDLVIMGGDLYEPKDLQSNEFLRQSNSPVVILKCMINQLEKFKDIIFLADVDNDSEKLISHAKELQSLLKAKIHVVRVNTPKNFLAPKRCKETLENFVSRCRLENTELVSLEAKTEIEGLMSYCETIKNAFVCLGIHERSFLQSLITSSISEGEVIANSIHPVWTFKD
ncbi:universal stress protein [Ekhidna sp.]